MVKAVWLRNRWLKYARKDSLTDQMKSIFLRLGYRERGPYLVKTVG